MHLWCIQSSKDAFLHFEYISVRTGTFQGLGTTCPAQRGYKQVPGDMEAIFSEHPLLDRMTWLYSFRTYEVFCYSHLLLPPRASCPGTIIFRPGTQSWCSRETTLESRCTSCGLWLSPNYRVSSSGQVPFVLAKETSHPLGMESLSSILLFLILPLAFPPPAHGSLRKTLLE